jgi:hypothetical protein
MLGRFGRYYGRVRHLGEYGCLFVVVFFFFLPPLSSLLLFQFVLISFLCPFSFFFQTSFFSYFASFLTRPFLAANDPSQAEGLQVWELGGGRMEDGTGQFFF